VTRRLLPPSDWHRLAGTELDTVWPLLPVDRSCVLVVEDAEGAIVATWAFTLVLHAEGVWIAPQHRNGTVVARHLLRGLREVAADMRAPTVWTGSTNEQIAALCRGLGATALLDAHGDPVTSWVIPMVKGES
jgi:hypothetical protein